MEISAILKSDRSYAKERCRKTHCRSWPIFASMEGNTTPCAPITACSTAASTAADRSTWTDQHCTDVDKGKGRDDRGRISPITAPNNGVRLTRRIAATFPTLIVFAWSNIIRTS